MASAGLVPLLNANILQGPSTRTKVIGPDGSIIDAYAPGGKILLDGNAGPLLQTAPVVLAQPALDAYVLPQSNSVEVAAQEIPDVVARISEDGEKVLLHPGTVPRVETRESVPITEETDETVAPTTELAPTTQYYTSVADLSGTYVPDKLEKLYDDGSYRPEHY